MRLRELFEQTPAGKIVAVMPGGFHPFHPGHKSLYDWATKTFGKENVYVAATNDTKSRPFPFDVKQQLASMAGVPADRFIQVKSPFSALSYEGIIGNPENTSLIFIRSEKDKSSHPLPDQIRKSDGNMGYLISFKNKDNLETADAHGYIAYGPTIDFNFSGMQIRSATELRNAWPTMSEEDKHKAAELMYGSGHDEAVKLLDQALAGDTVGEDTVKEKVQTALPKKIKPIKMPTPPQAPTGPDGTDNSGTRISTTKKGNRSVASGVGTYIFTPKGKLILYMSPKIGGLQQTHNIQKQTITVDFGTSVDQGDGDVNVSQKGTYDMQGNLISADNTNFKSGGVELDLDKQKGTTLNYRVSDKDTVSANTKTGVSVRQNDADGNTVESIIENLTSADIPVVQYDRKYGGDVEKVLAVKRNAKADAEALYKKLGGISHANYEIISKAAEQKKQELRKVYRDALAQKGIKGAAALKSPEYKLFKKQNADMSIMLGTAMRMAVDTSKQSGTATGGGITVRNN